MRYFTVLAFIFVFFAPIRAQTPQCPQYLTASAFFDGESLWWHEDAAEQAFSGQCTFVFDPENLTFTLRTSVDVCHWAFEIVRATSPEQCPFQPYQWNWSYVNDGQHSLQLQFPATIAPCVPSPGSNAPPYGFRFRVQYKVPVKEVKVVRG